MQRNGLRQKEYEEEIRNTKEEIRKEDVLGVWLGSVRGFLEHVRGAWGILGVE